MGWVGLDVPLQTYAKTTGVGPALAGAAVSGAGAYLGGHLTEARKVASRHPACDEPSQRAWRAHLPNTASSTCFLGAGAASA